MEAYMKIFMGVALGVGHGEGRRWLNIVHVFCTLYAHFHVYDDWVLQWIIFMLSPYNKMMLYFQSQTRWMRIILRIVYMRYTSNLNFF